MPAQYPNIFISAKIAKAVGDEAIHMRNLGLGSTYDMDYILKLINKHGPVTRKKIDETLMNKLPDYLSSEQKKKRINYYLFKMAKARKIHNEGSRRSPK
ncbi:MAG TPA: hypothetical protein DEQ03_00645 [Marinilabiliales bacterium]|nr:hypothetical protein [Marinilabiliales bacterium]